MRGIAGAEADTPGRIVFVTLLSAVAGALYSAVGYDSPATGAIGGACNGALLAFIEGYVLSGWARARLNRAPFAVYLALRVAIYVAAVVFVNALATPFLLSGVASPHMTSADVWFALGMCVAVNLLFGVNDLLGPGVLFAFVAGRYRRPRRERRALLCLDLCGSTALAERLGEERFLDLLNAFFADVGAAIVAEGGEIHKYVGDEVIATWRADADPARPVRAGLAARRRLDARAATYARDFGAAVAFRAALHEGPVVIGELGAQKKEIALIGDAMNTAARILDTARAEKLDFLVSAPCYERVKASPRGIVARKLAPIALRGKSAPLELISLGDEGAA